MKKRIEAPGILQEKTRKKEDHELCDKSNLDPCLCVTLSHSCKHKEFKCLSLKWPYKSFETVFALKSRPKSITDGVQANAKPRKAQLHGHYASIIGVHRGFRACFEPPTTGVSSNSGGPRKSLGKVGENRRPGNLGKALDLI
jgi:hypothetical protein